MLRGGLLGRWLRCEVVGMGLRVRDVYGGWDGDEGWVDGLVWISR